jgi:predicted RNase H-like HicB family nuclease
MKIEGIIIKDADKGKWFSFIRQFPGICAQGDTIEEAKTKMNTYFQAYLERMSRSEIDVEEEPFEFA